MGQKEEVQKIKWILSDEKDGNEGKIDKIDQGMLKIEIGEEKKKVNYVMEGKKVYSFKVKWGEES